MPFLFAIVALIVLSLVNSEAAASPNVLLIITDDQGYGDFSIHGNPHVRTPHIDQLGKSAVRFDRFYVNSFCAPSRAALLTGRWPLRCGVHGVTHNREAMRSDEVTIAEALLKAGYHTGCIGKWHNGEQFPFTPPGQGFDEFFGFHNGHWNNYFDATLLRGAYPEPTRGYITDVLTDEALRFIDRRGDRPFFCYLAYNAPHSPYQVPDKYYDRFRQLGFDEKVSAFWGMCENIDDNVGRLLAGLNERGLTRDTIVLFLTDNGGTAGVKIYNAGMRGGKTSVHEGGSRVPLFVRWAAAGWQPHVVDSIVSHIDLYPTLLDLCGVDTPSGPPVDGLSLRPLLDKPDAIWPQRVLFTHNPIDETNRYPGAVRTQQYRLVREIKGPAGGSRATNNDRGAANWQLYDMQADPGETRNIAADQPQQVAELSALYEQWIDDIRQPPLQRLPIEVGHQEENPVEIHAPQAYYTAPLRFNSGPGFANDWLTNWISLDAGVRFDIDVQQPGNYRVELGCTARPEDAGAKVRVTLGEESHEVEVPSAPLQPIALPHRDTDGQQRYQNRHWTAVPAGNFTLSTGRSQLSIEAIAKPGEQVMDLKHVRLERLP
ncbi:MAG: arylsulfatase [Planctomycetaceae bacterium]